MKKAILFMAFAAVCGVGQAKILRVNNTTGSGAPYSKISDALTAASAGDTIMVDGSRTSYENVGIGKKVVLMGPGYWRSENGITGQGTIGTLTINSTGQGTIVQGLAIGYININANNVVITRCHVTNEINVGATVGASADNCIIHQNFIEGKVDGYSTTTRPNYTQITNNIFNFGSTQKGNMITCLNAATIAYNTITTPKNDGGIKHISNITGCTLTKNIFTGNEDHIDGNTYNDNYMPAEWGMYIYNHRESDLSIKNEQLSEEDAAAIEGMGAFNGDDPYVISGVPTGPVIQGVTVPASVEQGNNLNITIKLGVQR